MEKSYIYLLSLMRSSPRNKIAEEEITNKVGEDISQNKGSYAALLVLIIKLIYFYFVAFLAHATVSLVLFLCDFSATPHTLENLSFLAHSTSNLQTCHRTLRSTDNPRTSNTLAQMLRSLASCITDGYLWERKRRKITRTKSSCKLMVADGL